MKRTLAHYWRYAKGIRGYGIAVLVLYGLGYLVNMVVRPLALKNLIDGLITRQASITSLVTIFVLVFVLKEIFFRTGDFCIAYFEAKHMLKLRQISIDHVLKHSLNFFAKKGGGSLVAKNRRFIASGEKLFDDIAMQYLSIVIQIVGVLVVVSALSWYLFVSYLVWISICFLVVLATFKRRMELNETTAKMDSKVTAYFADIALNISIVKRFGGHKREEAGFMKVAEEHNKIVLKNWNYSNVQHILQALCTQGMYFTSLVISLWLWKYHGLTPGSIVLVMTYSATLSESTWMFARSLKSFTTNIADASEMLDVIEKPAEIVDHPDAESHPIVQVHEANILFKDVTFSYKNNNTLFTNFSLEIQAGQKIGIVGTTGAGKSTLVNLLLRNIEPQSGSIFIGGYDIATSITQDGLKSIVSSVGQQVDMFNRKINENIAYGKPDASVGEVIAAAKKAQIHDFITTLKYGYETYVGDRGVRLSGGQRQRVALAQAILHNAPVLVLDEATSSLDNITEQGIQEFIENELQEKTVIVIAHRLTTIQNCDRILVMEHGTIVQDGTHTELMQKTDGLYYAMIQASIKN